MSLCAYVKIQKRFQEKVLYEKTQFVLMQKICFLNPFFANFSMFRSKAFFFIGFQKHKQMDP